MKSNRQFWWMITGCSVCVMLATFGFRELFVCDGVSVTWLLFSFSMLALGIFGFALAFIAFPIREKIDSVPCRILLFGTGAGLLWSLAPGGLDGNGAFKIFGMPTVLIAGSLTGIAISFALYKPLMKAGRVDAFFLGIVALPFGAFCFGLCEPLTYFITHGVSMAPDNDSFAPLQLGLEYAVLSLISVYVAFLIPVALLTTFFLRAVILHKTNG